MFSNYQRLLTNLGAQLIWLAVIVQFVLTLQTHTGHPLETTVRFFSYFTILSNIASALYFTALLLPKSRLNHFFSRDGNATAVVVYIVLGCLTYQFLLRAIWHTDGLPKIVDELLHTIIPIFVVQYWFMFANKKDLHLKQIPKWSGYLVYYTAYITLRGAITNIYPYPFIDVTLLGYPGALLNLLGIFTAFAVVSIGFVLFGKYIAYTKHTL
jgi:hypothetical protein